MVLKERWSCHRGPKEPIRIQRKPFLSKTPLAHILFIVIHFLSSTILSSRSFSNNQQQVDLGLRSLIKPLETDLFNRPPNTHIVTSNNQPDQQFTTKLYIDSLNEASFVLPMHGPPIISNLSLPKSETHFVNYNKESRIFTFLGDNGLKNCTILTIASESPKPAKTDNDIVIISANATQNERDNEVVGPQQSRPRRASATKLKNYSPANQTISSSSQYKPVPNESNKRSNEKQIITKRSDLVADSSSSPQAKTMVLVTTKSGKFSELVPLEELILAPTNINHDMNLMRPLFDEISHSMSSYQNGPPLYLASSIGRLKSQPDGRPDLRDTILDDDDNRLNRLPNVPIIAGAKSNQNHNMIGGSSNNAHLTQPRAANQKPSKPTPMASTNPWPTAIIDQSDDDEDDEDGPISETASLQLENQKNNPQQQPKMNPSIERRQGYQEAFPILPVHTDNLSYVRNTKQDLNVAAGHYYKKKKPKHKKPKEKKKKKHHDHGKYYMYAKVPKKKTWEFGYKRGNKKHKIERHEKGHKSHFKTKVKWEDKKSKGKGIHIWDYNHFDKKKKKF